DVQAGVRTGEGGEARGLGRAEQQGGLPGRAGAEEKDGAGESAGRSGNLNFSREVGNGPAREVDSPGTVCYTPRPLQPRGTRRDGSKVLDAQQLAAVGSAPLAGVLDTAGGRGRRKCGVGRACLVGL